MRTKLPNLWHWLVRPLRTKLLDLWRWLMHRLPEGALALCLLALVPLAVFVAQEGLVQVGRAWGYPKEYLDDLRHDPWPALAVFTCVVGTAALAFVLWRNWTLIWAVARKMMAEALHRKVVLILLVFFVVLTLTLPFLLKTEGSIKSQVQIMLMYSLALALVLLSLVAIFVSAASICSEIERKEVQVTDTKPLRRWQFLFGKWLGAVIMCMAVLSVMAGAAYLLVAYKIRPPDYAGMKPTEAEKAKQDYDSVFRDVLVARRSVKALEPPGIDEQTEQLVADLRAQGKLPEKPTVRARVIKEVRNGVLAERLKVEPGSSLPWLIPGLKPGQEGGIQVRFRAYASGLERRLLGRWVIYQRESVQAEGGQGPAREGFRPTGIVLPPGSDWSSDLAQEFTIPASYICSDGALYLSYENRSPRASVTFDGGLLVQVLQEEKTFFPNYYRTLVILFCHVALLAALGLMAGSVFSFPVASLTVMFFFVVGLIGPWLVQFTEPYRFSEFPLALDIAYTIVRNLLKGFLAVVPHFGAFNPLGDLTDGKLIPWRTVFGAGAIMLYVKGGFALLIGMYFYSRRELARVIV